jgi:glycosyltransferase involved in cell wall biosynthesis
MIGRLTPAKFVEEGVRAFELIRRIDSAAELDIVGGGDPRYRQKLERMIRRRGIAGVTFHGRVDETAKRALLAGAHVHLFTSHREGWGLVVSEAAAVGTPSVGYDVPGVRDSIADPRLLAPRGDAEALAARVEALSRDADLYVDVRTEAWERTRSMSYDETAAAFERLLTGAWTPSTAVMASPT